MPRGDRTGPNGLGPRTGRAMGFCAGHNNPGCVNSCFGYGRGSGFGREYAQKFGRGFGRRFFFAQETQPIQSKEFNEKKLLEELKAEKKELEKAINDLEQKNKKITKTETNKK